MNVALQAASEREKLSAMVSHVSSAAATSQVGGGAVKSERESSPQATRASANANASLANASNPNPYLQAFAQWQNLAASNGLLALGNPLMAMPAAMMAMISTAGQQTGAASSRVAPSPGLDGLSPPASASRERERLGDRDAAHSERAPVGTGGRQALSPREMDVQHELLSSARSELLERTTPGSPLHMHSAQLNPNPSQQSGAFRSQSPQPQVLAHAAQSHQTHPHPHPHPHSHYPSAVGVGLSDVKEAATRKISLPHLFPNAAPPPPPPAAAEEQLASSSPATLAHPLSLMFASHAAAQSLSASLRMPQAQANALAASQAAAPIQMQAAATSAPASLPHAHCGFDYEGGASAASPTASGPLDSSQLLAGAICGPIRRRANEKLSSNPVAAGALPQWHWRCIARPRALCARAPQTRNRNRESERRGEESQSYRVTSMLLFTRRVEDIVRAIADRQSTYPTRTYEYVHCTL